MTSARKIVDGDKDASIREKIERPHPALIERAAAFCAATLHEASGQLGALPSAIKPVTPDLKLCGPAVTVLSPPSDNLWLHRAIYVAQPGDILVVDVGGFSEAGYWGEIMTHAAIARRLGGLVIDGCVRDGPLLQGLGLPIFSRGLCIRAIGKDQQARGSVNQPIRIGEIVIQPGDLVAGDRDGVVIIPLSQIEATLANSAAREEKEDRVIKELAAGRSTLEIYGFE